MKVRSVYFFVIFLIIFCTLPVVSEEAEIISPSTENTVPTLGLLSGISTAEAHVVTPHTLTIPSIKVNAPVIATGLSTDGRMEVPNNFTQIGWYKFGAHPGEVGSMVMGAHVDN